MRKGRFFAPLVLLSLASSFPVELLAQTASPRRTPVVAVVERVSPSVVNISAESIVREVDPFFGNFFGGSRQRKSQSLGSGLIVDASGLVVTNEHVIEGASRILVTTLDGRELEATVLGSDRDADLAVLKVAAKGLPATPLGKSANLLMGETVVAIGNPFGLSHSVTTGVLSARGRTVGGSDGGRGGRRTLFTDFLQTDAAINPGNSGGPLVNLDGQVIGINTAIIQGASGIGFAIPADRAQRVVDDLLRFGELQPLWLGMRLMTIDPELAAREGYSVAHGVLVERVDDGSPAARAGVLSGDLVITVDGRPVAAREDLSTAYYSVPPGTPVLLELKRGKETVKFAVAAIRPPQGMGLRLLESSVGLRVEVQRGRLVVTSVARGSAADERGLEPGDVVLGANGNEVADPEALGREVLRGFDRGGLLLVVQRGRFAYNLSFPL
ncbi:MAG: trypsin-like peptidase domain-containing protein [Thermoanaerobaculia bacterium]